MATMTQEFESAPMGRRVALTAALVFGIVLIAVVINATLVAG